MAIAHRPDAAEATRKLFDEHARAVLAICRVMLRDPDEAEDAAQQTFLAVHRSLLRGTVPLNPGAWVATIARNECKARLRRNGSKPLPLEGEVVTDSEEAHTDAVSESLAELPQRQREAVVLRDVFGLSHTEIATALGVNVGAVNPLLTRARGRLRNRLRWVSRGAPSVLLPALRDQLAQLIPGFETSAGTATGAGALGLAAKLASAPAAAKVAALVGVATVGATAPQLARHRPPTTQSAPLAAAPTHVAPARFHAERPAAVHHRRRGHDDGARERGSGRTDSGGSHERSGRGNSGGGGTSDAASAPAPEANSGSGKTPPTSSESGHGGGPGPSATTTTPTTDGGASTRGPGGETATTTTVETTPTVETHSGPGGEGGGGTDGGEAHVDTGGSGSGKDGSGG